MTTPLLSVAAGNPAAILPHLFAGYLVVATLPTHTVSSDGNTLTKTTNGALTLDGATPAVGDTFLYVPSAASAESGYYKVVAVGSGGAQWVVTRVDGWQAGVTLPTFLARFTILYGTVAGRDVYLINVGSAIVLGTSLCVVLAAGSGSPEASYGDSSGTPGAATLDAGCGRSAIALGASSVVITNALCAADSVVHVTAEDRDATAIDLCAVPAAGSFTVTAAANATAATKFRWTVVRKVSPL